MECARRALSPCCEALSQERLECELAACGFEEIAARVAAAGADVGADRGECGAMSVRGQVAVPDKRLLNGC